MTLTDTRSAVEQLVLELAEVWLHRHARTVGMEKHTEQWREAVTGVCDGWAVMYLLLQLREASPEVADHAAAFLHVAGDAVDLPRSVADWQHAIVDHRPTAPLLP